MYRYVSHTNDCIEFVRDLPFVEYKTKPESHPDDPPPEWRGYCEKE